MTVPFWQSKTLAEMSRSEWESLCDGCGKCCLHKLIDDDTEQLYVTDVSCLLLNTEEGCCNDYARRKQLVPDCVHITPDNLATLYYLPHSCAYRRLAEGRDLAAWHPLRHGGDRSAMIAAGMSVVGRCISEAACDEALEQRIVSWPLADCE